MLGLEYHSIIYDCDTFLGAYSSNLKHTYTHNYLLMPTINGTLKSFKTKLDLAVIHQPKKASLMQPVRSRGVTKCLIWPLSMNTALYIFFFILFFFWGTLFFKMFYCGGGICYAVYSLMKTNPRQGSLYNWLFSAYNMFWNAEVDENIHAPQPFNPWILFYVDFWGTT